MNITIEMIDTAVKILMGAMASSLFFVWYWQMVRKKGEHLTQAQQRRLSLLEKVAADVGRVHHHYQQFLVLALEFSRHGRHWPPSRRQELRRQADELVDIFAALTEAESTLLLLGEKKLERALRIYGARIVSLRRLVHADKNEFNAEELQMLDDLKKDISQLRDTFYESLSTRFSAVTA